MRAETSTASKEAWVLPATEIVSVGLPFCAFKVLTGVVARGEPGWAPVGWLLAGWGVIDLALNVINLGALVAVRRRVSGVCLAQMALQRLRPAGGADLGLAIDVLLSFVLVAVMVGFGLIPRLGATEALVWNASVVLNVLGAGVGRVLAAWRARPRGEREAVASGG